MKHLLDNIFWHALSGPQAKFAAGNKAARRYAPGFSAIVAFADQLRPDVSALAAFCEPGEHFYTEGWTGAAPAGWQIKVETAMLKMIWEADMPPADDASDAVPLNAKHALQALELAELTHPGPFALRTIELGEYFGVFDGERLIAMAGERSHAGMLREISGVCTHPNFQGRGLAKRLMLKLIRREMLRNETPFLHVMHDNIGARRLYERMGFRNYKETVIRVISRD
jgi:ribosomal protein S18 acetylase RimI-like enzyme